MNKRIDYFDIAKGIAMLCIIAGHMGHDKINQFVFTFHVPLFFLVSGYFLNDKLSVKEYAKTRTRQLMIPYVIAWGGITVGELIRIYAWLHSPVAALRTLVNQILSGLYGNGSEIHWIIFENGFGVPTVGAIWFLPALLFSLVIVRYFVQWEHGGICIFVVALLGYASSSAAWMPLSIQSGMVASSFVYLGMLAHKYEIMEKKFPKEIFVGTIALWMFCVLFCGEMYLVENRFNHGVLDYAGALAGSYVVLCVSRALEEKTQIISKILLFFGKNSLVVMCVHAVELKVIHWDELLGGVLGRGVPAVIVYLVAKIILCTVVTVIVIRVQYFCSRYVMRRKSKKVDDLVDKQSIKR